ncbi:MAG TPA: SMP-30/gluconolactonase/LRE family protein [Tepidisphaeraceae bacterium]|jgi:gluconolactonase
MNNRRVQLGQLIAILAVTCVPLACGSPQGGGSEKREARAAMSSKDPVAPGAKPQKISSDYLFTEGPAMDKEGNIYFTDQPNDRIVRWDAATGRFADWMKPCGRSNGLCVSNDGRSLIACADEKNELWSIDLASKRQTVLVKEYKGKLLNGPNDVWQRPDGGIYFTDPFYKRDYWKRGPIVQDVQGVYYLSPDGKKLTRVVDDLKQPNGIIGTPDGRTLYVADIEAHKTYAYSIHDDGSLSDKKLFCEMGSDGMTLDDRGNVYLTGKGVSVFDRSGAKVAQIDINEPWTANVCFGGREKDTLFITASKAVYTLKMGARGAGSQ